METPSPDKPQKPVSEYTQGILNRTKQARAEAGFTQDDIAVILGITQGRYKHYEKRTPLPHRFVERFCRATKVTEHWLLTGHGQRKAA